MNYGNFKKLSRGLVIAVFIDALIAGVDVTKGKPTSHGWTLVSAHPTILLHILVSIGILAMAVLLVVQAIQKRNLVWMVISSIGLVAVAWTFIEGEMYVAGNHNSALDVMGNLAAALLIIFGIGWFLGHHQEKSSGHADAASKRSS